MVRQLYIDQKIPPGDMINYKIISSVHFFFPQTLLCYYSFCQGTSLGFWSFFLYEICRTSICSLIIPKWRHFSDITGLFIRYLTADAWVSGPDLAPQKILLCQQFRHLMKCKKYLEKNFLPCLVSEIQLFVYIFGQNSKWPPKFRKGSPVFFSC